MSLFIHIVILVSVDEICISYTSPLDLKLNLRENDRDQTTPPTTSAQNGGK